ncbi:protein RRP5 homolog [Rhipicephalus sanguineus]|uniref:protein RRP5 homolog n=1 Tax=Rhipicephalus sanguineus TaxID=34632 RepID=UPI001893B53A|nr:protein RRP5 homolog [Rhipicephalus sanguineus]
MATSCDRVAEVRESIEASGEVDFQNYAGMRLYLGCRSNADLGKLLEEWPAVGSSDDEDCDKGCANRSRKDVCKEREQAEDQLRKKGRTLVDPSREPKTVDDFDRLVLVSLNNSIVWLQYMAFHLRQAEIEKARAVARRALSCINFREEQEKLNVWTALLNLEHMYGTRDSLNSVFKEAVQFNEPLKVYEHLAQIYAAGSEREYKQMLNKFKQHADVWLSFGLFYMKCGQTEDCRDLLRRALKSLPSWEHIVLMTKFAQIEFTYGDAARG